jgi:hypothetical protein
MANYASLIRPCHSEIEYTPTPSFSAARPAAA